MGRMPATGKTEEQVEDIAGRLAESGYGLAYDDSQGLMKKTRNGPQRSDVAQTFAESDVTVSHSKTTVSSNKVRLKNLLNGDVINGLPTTSDAGTTKSEYGVVINPNVDLHGVIIDKSSGNSNSSMNDARVYASDGTQLARGNPGQEIAVELKAGNEYALALGRDSDSYSYYKEAYDSTPSYPYSSSQFDVVDGYDAGSFNGTGANVVAVTGLKDAMSGQVNVEWSNLPSYIYEWDVATFVKSLNGETVDVYVSYSNDGGSTWTRLNGGSPISRNFSLAAAQSNVTGFDKDSDVRFEAELSRTDHTNAPTFDRAYRSWVL